MLKRNIITVVIALLLSAASNNAFGHDIEVKNYDGVTIYYNYINDGTELEVTYKTNTYNSYSGIVVIPEEITYMNRTRKVTTIGTSAFAECSGLTSVTIGNAVTHIGISAFQKCSGLASVTIGNAVTTIGFNAFEECFSLTSVAIPNSVTTIGDDAFSECIRLASVTIGNAVTTIGSYAFWGCISLTSVIIPNSVTTIGNYAFEYCSRLTSVTIPNSVTTIGDKAFDRCDNIKEVVSLIEDPREITDKNSDFRIFSLNTFNNATLYVPVGTIDKYKATAGWQDFQFIGDGIPTSILTLKSAYGLIQQDGKALTVSGAPAGTPIAVYDLSGRLINSAKAVEGTTRIDAVTADKVVIVRAGERTVKVAMK